MKIKNISLVLLATAALTMNCQGKKEEAHDHSAASADTAAVAPEPAQAPQFTVDQKFQQQLAEVFKSYLAVKDALVESNSSKVKETAAAAQTTLRNVDMALLTGAAHNDWMTYLSGIEISLKAIQTADDVEAQRKAFKNLSESLYKSIKAFGLAGTTAYYDFCPMAFNNEGANWLSANEAIRNPYFGDKMMTCGSVEEKINL